VPKLKTLSSAKKRFRLTATGKIKRRKAFAGHLRTKKTPKRIRNLRKHTMVGSEDLYKVRKMLPYA